MKVMNVLMLQTRSKQRNYFYFPFHASPRTEKRVEEVVKPRVTEFGELSIAQSDDVFIKAMGFNCAFLRSLL